MKIYRSPQSLDGAQRSCDLLAKSGLLYQRVDAGRAVDLEPALADTASTLAGALYFERDEVGDCNKFTQGLAARCAARGVRYHYDTTVKDIETKGGKVTAVVTDKGRIAGDLVVAAIASFTAPLLKPLGIRVLRSIRSRGVDHIPARRME